MSPETPAISRPEDVMLEHYDAALARHGDTPQGALWPNAADRNTRFDVMLDLLADQAGGPVVLCDLGCGTGELLKRIHERGLSHIDYLGVDRSRSALELARAKFPGERFVELDVNSPGADLSGIECDFLVANGLFTVKHLMSHEDMARFLETTVGNVWPWVRRGLAFNVMSKVVDWERDDLFHASMDDMARVLHKLAGRRVRMRADYGLYEFTCYAYKDPPPPAADAPPEASTSESDVVRVLRPRLPTADELLPYLRRIDAARIYSNFGPLALELEGRLGRHFALPAGGVVSAGTGTAALVGSILACAGRARPDRPLALMPSYTFVATAVAAQECGYEPHLADVDADTWLLDPCKLAGHPNLDRIGVVMPVATYGRPVAQAEWMQFRELTGIPVVIDGAASFETIAEDPSRFLGPIPVAISLHATKSLGTGEGGCVATNDIGLATLIGQALNFGFHFSRDSCAPSTNGKMSEFHAAVGLADLSGWELKRRAFRRVAERYRSGLTQAGLGAQLHCAPDICSSYVLFHCRDPGQSARLQEALKRHGIEFRLWYGLGLQHQPYFSRSEADSMPVTDALAPCLLGLPMALDLPDAVIDRVVQAVIDGTRRCLPHAV